MPRIKFCLEFEKSAILSNFRGRGFEEEYEPDGDWDIIWSTVVGFCVATVARETLVKLHLLCLLSDTADSCFYLRRCQIRGSAPSAHQSLPHSL